MTKPASNSTPPTTPENNCNPTLPQDPNNGFLFQANRDCGKLDYYNIVLVSKCSGCDADARLFNLTVSSKDLNIKMEQVLKTHKNVCTTRSFSGGVSGTITLSLLVADVLSEPTLRSLLFTPTTQFVDAATALPYVRETSVIRCGQEFPTYDFYLNPNTDPRNVSGAMVFPSVQLTGIEEISANGEDPSYFMISFLITSQVEYLRNLV